MTEIERKYLTIDEACDYLRLSSRTQIRYLVRNNLISRYELEFDKGATVLLFNKQMLDDLMDKRLVLRPDSQLPEELSSEES